MEDLKTAIETLQRVREAKLAELRAIDVALQALGAPAGSGTQTHRLESKDFEDLGIRTATRRYLAEVGEPRTTREIADALRERGVRTRSKKYTATVYATLHNSSAFKRTEDNRWELTDTSPF
jgi:uncharacterized phage protein gp47/JayE